MNFAHEIVNKLKIAVVQISCFAGMYIECYSTVALLKETSDKRIFNVLFIS